MPTLHDAQVRIDAGEKESARDLLIPYLRDNPHNADAWWLMARTLDDPAQQREHLERALQVNPRHDRAKRFLSDLTPRPERHVPAPPQRNYAEVGSVINWKPWIMTLGFIAFIAAFVMLPRFLDSRLAAPRQTASKQLSESRGFIVPETDRQQTGRGSISVGQSVSGVIGEGADEWLFEGESGQRVRIRVNATSDALDPQVHLYDPSGELVGFNDDGGTMTLNAQLTIALRVDGEYQIVVGAYSGRGGYELTVR